MANSYYFILRKQIIKYKLGLYKSIVYFYLLSQSSSVHACLLDLLQMLIFIKDYTCL